MSIICCNANLFDNPSKTLGTAINNRPAGPFSDQEFQNYWIKYFNKNSEIWKFDTIFKNSSSRPYIPMLVAITKSGENEHLFENQYGFRFAYHVGTVHDLYAFSYDTSGYFVAHSIAFGLDNGWGIIDFMLSEHKPVRIAITISIENQEPITHQMECMNIYPGALYPFDLLIENGKLSLIRGKSIILDNLNEPLIEPEQMFNEIECK